MDFQNPWNKTVNGVVIHRNSVQTVETKIAQANDMMCRAEKNTRRR